MDNVLISIIIPVFNSQDFLEECFQSLLLQTESSFEVILIDDCSSDNSVSICETIANNDLRFRLLTHDENMRQSKTRNDGMAIANGKWIMFLDADDTLEINAIQNITNIIEKNDDVDFVFSPYIKCVGNESILQNVNLETGVYTNRDFLSFMLDTIPYHIFSCVGSKIYRKEFLTNNNILFDEKRKFNEDGLFAIESLKRAKKIYYLSEAFYRYRIRESDSVQSSYRPFLFNDLSQTDYQLKKLFEENDLFSIKKQLYYIKRLSVIAVSIENEVVFGNYKSYKNAVKCIKKADDYFGIISVKLKNLESRFLKIIIFSFKLKLYFLPFILLKAKKQKGLKK